MNAVHIITVNGLYTRVFADRQMAVDQVKRVLEYACLEDDYQVTCSEVTPSEWRIDYSKAGILIANSVIKILEESLVESPPKN